MRFVALLALSLLALPARAGDAFPPAYLFDVLRHDPYRTAWNKLMKDVQPTPDWLVKFDRNYDGAAGQVFEVTIDGKPYDISFVCKPEDCLGRRFEVLFEADGMRAYGALGGRDAPPAFYGAPAPAIQDALAKALHG